MSIEEPIGRGGRSASLAPTASILQAAPEFLDKIPFAIYACDRVGRILWYNERAAELWGQQPRIGDDAEKYCGSRWPNSDDRQIARYETPIASVLRTGIPVHGAQGKIERSDGSTLWVMMHIEPVEDENGSLIGAINCFYDVSNRVRAEEAIQEREQRLVSTFEQAGIGIAEVDAEGKHVRVNAHVAALLGCTPEELLGRSIFDLALADEVDEDRVQFRRQVNGEIERYSVEKRFKQRDGSTRWVSITSSSVRDREGRFLYAVRLQQDITARKAAEAALARRLEEQAALYEFTEALQHSSDLDEIYARALAAVRRALGCDRASIQLFDEAGVMRFVAWRGLSDSYRAKVEGQSPWPPKPVAPAPICIESLEAAELAERIKQTIWAEGIAALSFIPVLSNDRLVGKFTIYFDQPHVFSSAETDLALSVARQLGLALERRRAGRAAQHLVAIVESSHDAIVSKDLRGIIQSWNHAAECLFGYTAEEAVGKPITIIIPPDRLDEEPEILTRIRRGEQVDHFETVRRHKDGHLIDISLTISPVRDELGKIVGASKIARDITERKEAEAKLLESEQRLKDLLSAIPAAIYTTDAHGRITYFNDKAIELAGRTPRLGVDEWCVTWKLYRPDGTAMRHDECPMAIALKEGRLIRNAEAIAERPDGTRVPFIPYPTVLCDANGNIVGAINMLVDVSERKQAESQQRVLFDELNHRVKNNMQTLQSLLNLAGRRSRNPEAQKILKEASDRVAAMAAAQQVLYRTAAASSFNAQEFLEAVCETARKTFTREVKIVCEAGDAELSNDTAMPLALILNELLTNAIKHGINGSGQGTIRVGLTRQADSFVLCVEDRGPGFDLKSVRQRSSGLQLVEGLARQLRGTFEVTTNPTTRCSIRFS